MTAKDGEGLDQVDMAGADQAAEAAVQFRRTAGQIEGIERPSTQVVDHQVDGLGEHILATVRTGRDMTMQTLLVAAIAEIDLQSRRGPSPALPGRTRSRSRHQAEGRRASIRSRTR